MLDITLSSNITSPPVGSYKRITPLPDPDYEKTRERIKYDPSIHDYSTESPEWVEIRPGHFIYGSKSELANYEKELSAKESNA